MYAVWSVTHRNSPLILGSLFVSLNQEQLYPQIRQCQPAPDFDRRNE